MKKFKYDDQTFWPENRYIKVDDGTINSGVALKRRDAEVCLLDVGWKPRGGYTKKGTTHLLLPDRHIKFKIHAHKSLYYLMTAEDHKNPEDSC